MNKNNDDMVGDKRHEELKQYTLKLVQHIRGVIERKPLQEKIKTNKK